MFKKVDKNYIKPTILRNLFLLSVISFLIFCAVLFKTVNVQAEEIAYNETNFFLSESVEFGWDTANKKPTWYEPSKNHLICDYQGTMSPFGPDKKLKSDAKIKITYKYRDKEGNFIEIDHDDWVEGTKIKDTIETLSFGLTSFECLITPKSSADNFSNGQTLIKKEINVYAKMRIQEAIRVAARGTIPCLNPANNSWTYEYEISTEYNPLTPEQTILTYYTGTVNIPIFIYSKDYLEARYGDDIFALSSYEEFVGIETFKVKNNATNSVDYDKLIYKGNPENESKYLCNDIDEHTKNNLSGKEPGQYIDVGYNANESMYMKQTDDANSFISFLILPEPVLYTFSSQEQQVKYLNFNDGMQEWKTEAELKTLLDELLDVNDDFYNLKCLQTQKMLKLEKNSGKYKARINLRDSVQLLSETRIGKVYDRQDNQVVNLKSKISALPVELIYNILGSSVDGINKGANFKKVVSAGEYVVEIKVKNDDYYRLTNENNFYLVPSRLGVPAGNVKMEYQGNVSNDTYVMQGLIDLDDESSLNKYNVSLESKKGVQFNKIYLISKATLPNFDLLPPSKLIYDGESKPIQFSNYFVQDNVQYKVVYEKIVNGVVESITDESININGPKNAGKYLAKMEIIDPNYVLINHVRTVEFEIEKVRFSVYSVSVSETKGEYIDKKGKKQNGKYTIVEFGLVANETFVNAGDIYFLIDNGSKFSNDIKQLINLKRGKHKIAIYSTSENFLLSESGKPTVEYMNFEVPDTREVPLVGGFLGGIMPALANYDAQVAFLVGILLLIIAIIFVLRSLVLRKKAKKSKVKKAKKYDEYYAEILENKREKKEIKKANKRNKRKEKLEKIDEEIQDEEDSPNEQVQ